MELSRTEISEDRQLGIDPVSGRPVSARLGRYGPCVQIGKRDDEEKPRFASLRATQRIDTVTLDEALALFRLPRKLGFLPDGDEIEVNIGRSEEHTSELQSLMRISYAVFCLKNKK